MMLWAAGIMADPTVFPTLLDMGERRPQMRTTIGRRHHAGDSTHDLRHSSLPELWIAA
jgi:hypothetical protein